MQLLNFLSCPVFAFERGKSENYVSDILKNLLAVLHWLAISAFYFAELEQLINNHFCHKLANCNDIFLQERIIIIFGT